MSFQDQIDQQKIAADDVASLPPFLSMSRLFLPVYSVPNG